MKIVITGATGLIGSALARELARRGHEVIAAGRSAPAQGGWRMDFCAPPTRQWWREQLAGVDVVVNAAGIFSERRAGDFQRVHTLGPIELFEGAALAGVRCIVQISALGADAEAQTAFQRSKYLADQALARIAVPSATVLPSLVFSPEGQSSRWFLKLASLPVWALVRTRAHIQPIHLDDLVTCIAELVARAAPGKQLVPGVGPRPLALREYLQVLRGALGFRRPAWVLALPAGAALALLRLLARLGGGRLASPDALQMLLRGNTADAQGVARLLDHAPRDPADFLTPEQAGRWRERHALAQGYHLLRAAMAAVWIITGLVSLGLYPLQASLALLQDFGLQGRLAWSALYAGAFADLALGLALLVTPRRHMARLWRLQMLLILAYTALISWRIPHWWLHPFGPLTKNLPMLAGMVLMLQLEKRR